jgi:hypothetical protein
MQAFISVREWFDKGNGNTYHGVTVVTDDGRRVRSSWLRYGHGEDAYVHTAKLLLSGREDFSYTWDLVDPYTYTVVDVVRVSSKRAACFK